MEAAIRIVSSLGLITHAIYQVQRDPNWWLYVPSYLLAGLVCFMPFPRQYLWRLLSAISVLGGGLLMLFLWWTFTSLKNTVALEPAEAKNLLPISIGVALSCLTRISTDPISKPTHYIRAMILVSLLAISVTLIATSGKYYQY